MVKRISAIIVLSSIIVLVACASGSDEYYDSESAYFGEPMAEEVAPYDTGSANVAADTIQATFQAVEAQERLIVREGSMYVVVDDTDTSLAEIAHLAETKGGWVVSSDVYGGGGGKSGSITLRVPVDQFNDTMAVIRDMAVEVDSESTGSQDVTEEFVDLDARVANLEATAERVRAFLDDSRNVEEALEVNRELSRLEGEIESLKARMKYLGQSAAFSLLVIHLSPNELSQPIELGGWQPEGIARDAFETLLSALEGMGSVVIWASVFCVPLLLIFGIPLFIIGFYIYRRRNRKEETEPADEEVTDLTEEADEQE